MVHLRSLHGTTFQDWTRVRKQTAQSRKDREAALKIMSKDELVDLLIREQDSLEEAEMNRKEFEAEL